MALLGQHMANLSHHCPVVENTTRSVIAQPHTQGKIFFKIPRRQQSFSLKFKTLAFSSFTTSQCIIFQNFLIARIARQLEIQSLFNFVLILISMILKILLSLLGCNIKVIYFLKSRLFSYIPQYLQQPFRNCLIAFKILKIL